MPFIGQRSPTTRVLLKSFVPLFEKNTERVLEYIYYSVIEWKDAQCVFICLYFI